MVKDKKILYVDMDNVLVDFRSGIEELDAKTRKAFDERLDDVPGIFAVMKPIEGAIESYEKLAEVFDTYILSTAPWENPSAWSDKLLWVKRKLGVVAYKRLIITHHKNLNSGHYLVDDRTKNGADGFKGQHIHFGSPRFPDWAAVTQYLVSQLD